MIPTIGPKLFVTSVVTCTGCFALKQTKWDNGFGGSGITARCTASRDRPISGFWHDNDETPKWCPALKQGQEIS